MLLETELAFAGATSIFLSFEIVICKKYPKILKNKITGIKQIKTKPNPSNRKKYSIVITSRCKTLNAITDAFINGQKSNLVSDLTAN